MLVVKTILDSLARILLTFAWLTVLKGDFDALSATALYYVTFGILVLFNIIFNTSGIRCSADYLFGNILNMLFCLRLPLHLFQV